MMLQRIDLRSMGLVTIILSIGNNDTRLEMFCEKLP